ncbi:MAG: YjbQ family protein [Nitrososphaerota archaeon]|nr:YjbQ family protein [Nitrososphaerota archaeon]
MLRLHFPKTSMMETHRLEFATKGENDIVNITESVQNVVMNSEAHDGSVNLFLQSTTSSLTIIEWEPGLLNDFRSAMDRIASKSGIYEHELAWHDGNGHSHIRSGIIGGSLSIPFAKKKLLLGQWQQLVLVEFDVGPRKRTVIMQIHV